MMFLTSSRHVGVYPSRSCLWSHHSMSQITFPQYPDRPVTFVYLNDVPEEKLQLVKTEIVNKNPDFDFCFLNTAHVVSLEQLRCSLHKSLQNSVLDQMKSNNLNTEVILNLSPVNNIRDALRRFGVDETRLDVIVVSFNKSDPENFAKEMQSLLNANSAELTDEVLLKTYDAKRFQKLFKVQSSDQAELTQAAVTASLLRGL